MKPYQMTREEALAAMETQPQGLSAREAASRLEAHGPNRLAEGVKVSLWNRFVKQLAPELGITLPQEAAE